MEQKKLEDFLVFEKPVDGAVRRLIDLDEKLAVGIDPNVVHILDKCGELIDSFVGDDKFARTPSGEIIYLRYNRGKKDYSFVKKACPGGEREGGSIKIAGDLIELTSSAYGLKHAHLFTLANRIYKYTTISCFHQHIRVRREWTRRIARPCGARSLVATDAGKLYASLEDNTLHVFDQNNGKKLAEYALPGIRMDAADESVGYVAVGAKHAGFVSVLKDGAQLWQDELGQVLAVKIVGDTVLAGTECFGGSLYALDLNSGNRLWELKMPQDRGIWCMLAKEDKLFLGTGIGGEGSLYALDLDKLLAQKWRGPSRKLEQISEN